MINKPRILGIIPARTGSKGIPNKNMRLLAGKPLIQYTIETALLCNCVQTIMVSSDGEEILRFCRNFPKLETPFIRPSELSMDNTPTIKVVQHALKYYTEIGRTFDYVCLLQPTSPFRNIDLIDNTVKKLIDKKGDSLITIRKIPNQYNPSWTFKMNKNILSPYIDDEVMIPRRQELQDAWYRDGKIYLTSVALIKQGKMFGGKLVGYINDEETNVNIDCVEDWELAEKLLANGFIY